MNEKGDGPYTHGNSFANGAAPPSWLRHNWELREALESRWSVWAFLP
ncbi:MAG TPA: hypothetical protein VK599_00445 [Streptosporangiaceae bacterium]|nr:hypothetical protein [Streptosporangiaceae bacterium]